MVPARRSTWAGGIDSLESIPGLLKSLKIPPQGSGNTVPLSLLEMGDLGLILFLLIPGQDLWNQFPFPSRARIYKRLRSPGIDSKESIPPDWESIPELLKKFTNSGSGHRGSPLLEFYNNPWGLGTK